MAKNVAPVITSTAAHAAGVVTEIANVTGSTALDTATDIITITDADVGDTHVVSAVALGTGFVGTFTPTLVTDSLNGATGQVRWTFSVADGALDFLAAGETLVQSYSVSINDQRGGIVTQTVTVTLTGTNDLPVVVAAATTATGSVTAIPNVSGSTALDTTSGTIAFTDADRSDTHTVGAPVALGTGYLGTFTVTPGADSTNGVTGIVTWNFSVVDGTLNFLAAGQTLVQNYSVTITDNHGGSVVENVAVTLIGSVHPTVIAPGTTASGAVTELPGVSGSTVLDSTSGTILFTDAGTSDTHTASVVAQGVGYVGSLTLGALKDSTGGVTGSVGWTFATPDGALDFLAAGQKVVQAYNVTITDNHGAATVQSVLVTLTGTNDVPTIALATASGSVTERAATLNSTIPDLATGAVAFKDLDLADTHTATAVAQGTGYLGTFTIGAVADSTGGVTGSVPWTFSVPDGALDFLAAGQTKTQSYLVTVADNHGGSATQTVTVTITGTNDAPVAQAITATVSTAQPTAILTAVYTDPDLIDTHTFTVDTTGTLGLVTNNGDGTFTYSTNGKFVGVTGTDHFNYTVLDNHGGTSTQTATIAIVFDAPPVIVPAATQAAGFVNELPGVTGSPLLDTATGAIAFTDADLADTHTASVVAQGAGYVGSLTVGPPAPDSTGGVTGSIKWTFSVVDSAIDFLGAGQTLVQKYDVTVADNHGGTVVQVVTVTITGANDPPVASPTATLTGAVTERPGLTGSPLLDTTSGLIAFTDSDTADTHTVSAAPVPQGTGYVGNLILGAVSDSTGGVTGTVPWTFSVADGALDFLAAGQKLVQNYNVTVADNHGGTLIEQVSVTLTGTNDAPVAHAIAVSMTNKDAPTTIIANYTDPDLIDFHTVTVGTVGTLGTVINNGNETFTYSQNGKFAGLANGATATDHFTYTVDDGHPGGVSTQTVTVTIVGAGAPPPPPPPPNPDHLVNDNWIVTHGEIAGFTAQAVLANDPAVAGLTLVSVSGPNVAFDPASGFITYTAPSVGFTDSFTYTTTDTLGHLSTATVNVTLTNAASTFVGSATSQAEWLNATGSSSPTTLIGGAGADRLIGGSAGDRITGGPGADILSGGALTGSDHFIYNYGGPAKPNIDSSLAAMDRITDFHGGGGGGGGGGGKVGGVANGDIIELNGFNFAPASIAAVTATAVALPFTSASVVGYFADGHAVHIESDATVGARSAQIYVDANHNGNFDAGQDLVIHVDGMKAAFTIADFQFH
jgi:VCBS repeat-containing protein